MHRYNDCQVATSYVWKRHIVQIALPTQDHGEFSTGVITYVVFILLLLFASPDIVVNLISIVKRTTNST